MTQRRGNGLLADAYVPLVRLPAARADVMLEALRRAGIAAYAAPVGGDVAEPVGAGADEPATDSLYVDVTERVGAEEILRAELPDLGGWAVDDSEEEEPTERAEPVDPAPVSDGQFDTSTREQGSDDDAWADLVARFYESGSGADRGSWPDVENLSAREQRERETGDNTDESASAEDRDDHPSSRMVRPARSDDSADTVASDGDDHYVPPEPPPFPRGDLVSRISWGGLFGGPVLLLGSMLLGIPLPGWLAFCAVAAFIAGFVVLVVRMSDYRPPGDGGVV